MRWRRMIAADLPEVHALAERIHVNHPEDLAVPSERLRLFPAGAMVLDGASELAGYAIGHPWEYANPPILDTMLGSLPANPTTFYVHDVAISPGGRGQGFAAQAVDTMIELARQSGVDHLSLVAVNRSETIWRRLGFETRGRPNMATKLLSYGADAVFMVRKVGSLTA